MPPKKTNQEVLDEATKAAQEAAKVSGLSYSGYSPTAITSDQLRNAEAVKFPTVPTTPNPTLTPIETALPETGKLGATEQTAQDLTSQMLGLTQSLAGKEQYRAQQEQASGIGALEATQKDLTSQYNALVNEQAAIPLALQEELKNRPGVSVRGATSVEEQSRQRQTAIKALTVNSLLQSTQGNIANARATADRAVNLKYADDEAKLSTLAKSLDIIQKSPAYTEEQKQRALKQQVLLDDRKRLLDQKKEDDQTIFAMANLAMKNNPGDQGAQMAAQQAIASGDIKKAFSLLGQYQDNPEEIKKALLESEYMRAQISKINADIRKTNADIGGTGIPSITNPNAVEYSGALQVILGSTTLTAEQKKTLVNAVNNGENPISVLKNKAKDIMGQTSATDLDKLEVARDQMLNLDTLIKSYYAKGGKTNLFKGTMEEVANKLGETTDPNLVEIAVQIKTSLQAYRNAISGTAYSEQEGRDINSIFPGIDKSEGLNTAIINARKKSFDESIDSKYRTALGKSYDVIKQAENNSAKGTLSSRDFVAQSVQKSGMKYNDILGKAPKGQIAVVDNKTGEIGYIPVAEFSNNYTRL